MKQERRQNGRCNRVVRLKKPDGLLEARDFSHGFFTVSNFNTEKATNLSEMFYNCQKISELDVSHFNTSNVSAMNHMFSGCYEVEVLNVSNFNTSKVKYMQLMFTNCKKVTNLDLSSF